MVESLDGLFELNPFFTQRLGALRIVPDIRVLELFQNFFQPVPFAIVVKDTPLAPSFGS